MGVIHFGEEKNRQQQNDRQNIKHLQYPRVVPDRPDLNLGQGQHQGHSNDACNELPHEKGCRSLMPVIAFQRRGRINPHHPHGHEQKCIEQHLAINGAADVGGHVRSEG